MDDPYAELRQSLSQAGFYMPDTENMGLWQRLIVCSEGPPQFPRYNGRSFWVALIEGLWYVGSWGSYFYRLANAGDLLPLIHDFLSDTGTMGDFSSRIKTEYQLTPLDESETARILPDGRTSR
jgi:hypothetical protein